MQPAAGTGTSQQVCVDLATSFFFSFFTCTLPKCSAARPLFTGCLLTIILLMRALDPLGYEKETLAHFQTLKVCHSRSQQQHSGAAATPSDPKPLFVIPGSGFHAFRVLQRPVQQVHD